MELVSFLILLVTSLGMTAWLSSRKSWYAIFATATYSFFIVGVIMLNVDPTLEIPMSTVGCTYTEQNNTWIPSCTAVEHTVTYDIDPTVMVITNVLVGVGIMFVLAIGYDHFINRTVKS